jgi:hypothetical protein
MGGAIERPSGVGTATRGGRVRPHIRRGVGEPFPMQGAPSLGSRGGSRVRAFRCRGSAGSGRAGSGGDLGRNDVDAQGGRRGKKCQGPVARGDRPGRPRWRSRSPSTPRPGAPVPDTHDPGHSATDAHHLTQHPPMPSAGLTQAHPLCQLGSRWLGVEEASSAGRSHQRLQCTTSWKGRRSGLTTGRSGRSAG